MFGRVHHCTDCVVERRGARGAAAVVGQHLIETLVHADDAQGWQQHLTVAGRHNVARILERGPQIVVTSHERPLREIQALALLLRNAGMPLQVLVNDGTTRMPVPFALPGRSPLHLVNALSALRRGDSVLFVLWRAPMRSRGLLPWEAPESPSRPAVGPVLLARRSGLPLTLARVETAGRRVARLNVVESVWCDRGRELDDEARALTLAVEPAVSAHVG